MWQEKSEFLSTERTLWYVTEIKSAFDTGTDPKDPRGGSDFYDGRYLKVSAEEKLPLFILEWRGFASDKEG